MLHSRRAFLSAMVALAALVRQPRMASAAVPCPFRLAVINDEIGQDFDHACSVIANDFGLGWIELRSLWGKNIVDLNDDEVERARQILAKYKLQVTDLATPLFKIHWPGAPLAKDGPRRTALQIEADFQRQSAVLTRSIALCKAFQTDRIRCFDFWRLEDSLPYRNAMNEVLANAAATCAQHNVFLVLENEMACNTGSGAEAVALLNAVPNPHLLLNWDPGNSATFAADVPYPDDYRKLPKGRIGHCHVKDTVRKPDGKFAWAPVGGGLIDWVGQFQAMASDGYHFAVSLETHWQGAIPAPGSSMTVGEASTRESMKGLKLALQKAGFSA